jgi:hypothetical protein
MKSHIKQMKSNIRKYLYNKKELQISPKNTMIIIDWDDTLYPTSWLMDNSIDITNPTSRYKYIANFENLDTHLSTMLSYLLSFGDILIITNALPTWIELSSSVLPKTRKVLKNIDIISARERYQNGNKMSEWKKKTFLDEILLRNAHKKYNNILSLGDAEFEYNALINLFDKNFIPNKYLKTIKFIKSSDYDIVVEQIKIVHDNIQKICSAKRHLDLTFSNSG